MFASEKNILVEIVNQFFKSKKTTFNQLSINYLYKLNFGKKLFEKFKIESSKNFSNNNFNKTKQIDCIIKKYDFIEFNNKKISNLQKCTKCILPETYPFIKFDNDGICNYCKIYKPQKN